MNKVKIFVSGADVKSVTELMDHLTEGCNDVVKLAFGEFKEAVENNTDENVPFREFVLQLAEYLMPLAKTYEDVYPLVNCNTVKEVEDVLEKFNFEPYNLGGNIINPVIADHMLGGEDFVILSGTEFKAKADAVTLPLTGVLTGFPVVNEFSKLSVIDTQQDIRLLTTTTDMLSDDLKVYVVRL